MKQSIYYSISPEQTAARFLRQTRRARAACIVLLAGLAAVEADLGPAGDPLISEKRIKAQERKEEPLCICISASRWW